MTQAYKITSLRPHSTPGFISWSCPPIPGPRSWYPKGVCVCVEALCRSTWVNGGQQFILSVFIDYSLFYMLRQALPLNPELAGSLV